MSTVIQIKRSSGTSAPATLKLGELAYTYGTGSQGNLGDRLFVGEGGVDGNGDANNITVIGGQYFVDQLDHVQGTLTASSAILVDSNKAIDELFIGNSTSTGGTIKFNEGTDNGSNFVALKAPNNQASDVTFTLPGSFSNGQFLTVDGSGVMSFAAVPSGSFDITGDSGTDTFTTGQTLTFAGGTSIDTAVTSNTVTINLAAIDASSTTISNIPNSSLTNSSVTVAGDSGSDGVSLGETLTVAGGTSITTAMTSNTITVNLDSIDADNTTITNLEVDNLKSGVLDTDLSSVSASDDTLASAKAIKAYVDTQLTAEDLDIAADSGDAQAIDLDSETLTIAGGTGISTVASTNTITINGDDATTSTKGIASFNSTDFSVSSGAVSLQDEKIQDVAGAMFTGNTETLITATYQDADGTVDLVVDNDLSNYDNSTSAFITASSTDTLTNKTINGSQLVDGSVSNAKLGNSSVTFAGDSGSDAVSLGGTLTISGTANEIETVATTDTITIGLPNDVTVSNDLTVTGNLTVNGTTTTVDSTNTTIADNLLELNSGAASNANDTGIIIERGSTGDNAIIAWDESADKFTVGTTTATADSTGNLTITAGTLVANLEGDVTGNVTGNVTGDVTGNADTATAFATARNIAGQSFDGTGDITIASTDLSNTSSITLLTSTQTLTNKTIDADNNTITNIGDSELSSGISATKIGNGDVDNTELSYLNGVSSAIQTQLDTKASNAFAIAQAVALG